MKPGQNELALHLASCKLSCKCWGGGGVGVYYPGGEDGAELKYCP